MSVDQRSPFLNLPLPHEENYLEEDLPRLRETITGLDSYARITDSALKEQNVSTEALKEKINEHLAAENPHQIPNADHENAGLVRVAQGIEVVNGVISVPKATLDKAGLVRPDGQTCEVNADGILSIIVSGVLPGCVIPFSGLLRRSGQPQSHSTRRLGTGYELGLV